MSFRTPLLLEMKHGVFHHIPETKQARKNFDVNDEVQEEVMTWLKVQVADFYDSGMQTFFPRLNKCLENDGDYVEK